MVTREVAVIKDRETGDINELRDKKLADSTARTTSGDVQTTDSIRMLDTSGNEVYIARDSFMAAVKSCLGNIINSSTLKTEAPKTLVLDSGGDLGAVQPSTLASVLGAFISAGTTVPDDIYDNTKPPRMFSFSRQYSHDFLPVGTGAHTSFLISIPIKTVGWGKILFLYFGGGLSSGNFFYFQVYHYIEHAIWVKVV